MTAPEVQPLREEQRRIIERYASNPASGSLGDWLMQMLRIIDARDARIEELTSLLIEWSNFDFDCPDEYNEETDEEEEDGSALNHLYEKTGEVLRG
jgi:hypothetical protein